MKVNTGIKMLWEIPAAMKYFKCKETR